MGTYDDFDYGAHRDSLGRPKATYEERSHPSEDIVRDIVKNQAQPGRGLRQIDIAKELHARRDGDAIPFTGTHKRNVQNQANQILNNLQNKGEIEKKGRGIWGLAAPVGQPKDARYDTANDEYRTISRMQDRGIAPQGSGDPRTWGEARKRADAERDQNAQEIFDNAAEQAQAGGRRRWRAYGNQGTPAEQDAARRHEDWLREQSAKAPDNRGRRQRSVPSERKPDVFDRAAQRHKDRLDAERAKSPENTGHARGRGGGQPSGDTSHVQSQRSKWEAKMAAEKAKSEGTPQPKGGDTKNTPPKSKWNTPPDQW